MTTAAHIIPAERATTMFISLYIPFRPCSRSLSPRVLFFILFFHSRHSRVCTHGPNACVCVCVSLVTTADIRTGTQAPCLIGGCSFVCNSRFFLSLLFSFFFNFFFSYRVVIYMTHPGPSPSLSGKH